MFARIYKILQRGLKNVFAPMYIPLRAWELLQNHYCFLRSCSGFGCVFPPSPSDSGRAALDLKGVSGNEEGLHGCLWQELVIDLAWSSTEEGIFLRRGIFRWLFCVHMTHPDGSGVLGGDQERNVSLLFKTRVGWEDVR